MTDASGDHVSVSYTAPGMDPHEAGEVIGILQDRLNALNDLALTLKHVHWNVVGPNFIAVRTMLDPQVNAVREMVDDVAERVATLGGSPCGAPGTLVAQRSWTDYSVGRAYAVDHLGALDAVYDRVIADHRWAMERTEKPDRVTLDILVGQTAQLEQFHWFVRAHLEKPDGTLRTSAGRRSSR